MRSLAPGSQVFRIELVARPGTDATRALRDLLKIAGRRFELRCVDARQIEGPPVAVENSIPPMD